MLFFFWREKKLKCSSLDHQCPPKVLRRRVLPAYLRICVCVRGVLVPCASVYGTAARFETLRRLFCEWKTQTQMCAATQKRRLKPIQTLSPSDPSLEWLDKQVPFPNCVWRGNCARRAAAGPMAGAKRVHFVQHTRRIWRADVLSAAIQLQT